MMQHNAEKLLAVEKVGLVIAFAESDLIRRDLEEVYELDDYCVFVF